MESYEEIYNAFLKALGHFVEKDGYGSQSVIAANAGLSNAALSRILRQGNKKQASLKSQVSISKACGYDFADFIALGRKLLSGEEEPFTVRTNHIYEEPRAYQSNEAPNTEIDAITREHIELVKKFKYKELAKNINEDLLKIDDQETLKEVEVLIRAISLGMGFEVKLTGKNSKSAHQSRPVGKLKNGTED